MGWIGGLGHRKSQYLLPGWLVSVEFRCLQRYLPNNPLAILF